MFVLLGVKDTVPVAPNAFSVPPATAIHDALNAKYANKLISQKGLALSVYDILTSEDGKVTWGNGLMYYKVSFRLMLFAPFLGEVIVGKVIQTTKQYIRVSVGFFRDIYIIPGLLPPNSAYDPAENRFFWITPDEEDVVYTPAELLNTLKANRFYIDSGESIRFRVANVEWQDVRPTPHIPSAKLNGDVNEELLEPEKDPIEKAGYKILATIAESGLGIVSWWDSGVDEDEMGEGEVEDEAMDGV